MSLSIEEKRARRAAASRRHYARNRERILEGKRTARQEDPDRFRRYAQVTQSRLSAEQRERIRLKTARFRAENPNYMREWRAENAAKVAEAHALRRSRPVVIEDFSLEDVLLTWGTSCHICHEEIDFEAPRRQGTEGWERGLHLDHVVPICLGGDHILSNVKPSHGLCNLRKGRS